MTRKNRIDGCRPPWVNGRRTPEASSTSTELSWLPEDSASRSSRRRHVSTKGSLTVGTRIVGALLADRISSASVKLFPAEGHLIAFTRCCDVLEGLLEISTAFVVRVDEGAWQSRSSRPRDRRCPELWHPIKTFCGLNAPDCPWRSSTKTSACVGAGPRNRTLVEGCDGPDHLRRVRRWSAVRLR